MVGSSSSSTSGSRNSTEASATRMRQPPERAPQGRCCASSLEAEAGEDLRGAGGRRMRIDVGEALVDVGDAVRVARGLGLRQQAGALGIGRRAPSR